MIPLRDVIPSRTAPIATLGLVSVHAAAFLITFTGDRPPAIPESGWIALAASMVLAGSVVQAMANVLCLWIFGATVEDRMGHGRFVAFYLLCGLAGAAAYAAAEAATPTAAGAVAGVIGAYFVLYPHSRIVTLLPLVFALRVIELPAVTLAAIWVLVQIAGGGGEPPWPHLAGLTAGAAGVLLFRRPERLRVEWWNDAI